MQYPLKIISNNKKTGFNVNFDELESFIKKHTNNSSFAFIINYGLISQGKSTFSQSISGVDHRIGNGISSETKGAYISYCGTVKDIKKKFLITEKINVDENLHVFNIDTEGILFNSNEPISEFVLPLIQISSVVIIYGSSFTDLEIIPIISNIYHLTNSNILITLRDSHIILNDKNTNVLNYLNIAQNSILAKNLDSEKIQYELIPCIDFRIKVDHEFSKQMNKYFIIRLLNLIASQKWNDASFFIGKLRSIYSNQKQEFINALFAHDSTSDSILKVIKNECIAMVNEKIEKSKNDDNLLIYIQINQDVTKKFNYMCSKVEIEKEKKKKALNDIINYIEINRLNSESEIKRKEQLMHIIEEQNNKLEKEKQMVSFLSNEISNIASVSIMNIICFIQNKDSSSLKTIKSFFKAKCSETLTSASPFIRKEMFDYIKKDINDIADILKNKSESAAKMIDDENQENRKKKIQLGFQICGMIIGSICVVTGHQIIGKTICSISGVSAIPFNKTDNPKKENFVIKIKGKTYEANPDEIAAFCKKIGADVGKKAISLYDEISNNVDLSLTQSLPIDFEPRDYEKHLNDLFQK